MNIRQWIQKRTKPELSEDVSLVSFLSEVGEKFPLFKKHLETKVDIQKLEDYIKDPTALNKSTKFTDIAERNKYKEVLKEISSMQNLSIKDLKKGMPKNEANLLSVSHNEDGVKTVDDTQHKIDFAAPKEYQDFISSDSKENGLSEKGIEAKTVHRIGDDKYMTKPYHGEISRCFSTWAKHPITGWSSITTKALFTAGNEKRLCEDVSAHEVDGIPVTVHKFHKSAQSMGGDLRKHKDIAHEPNDIYKIGLMDYLSNNTDRHQDNILLDINNSAPTGEVPVIAIDHSLNFQYLESINDKFGNDIKTETPLDYINSSVLKHLNSRSNINYKGNSDLIDWWKSKAEPIKKAFVANLEHLKDEKLKDHMYKNFNSRWNTLNKWADKSSSGEYSKDTIDTLGHTDLHTPILSMSARKLTDLPKGNLEALGSVYDAVDKKKKLNYRQVSTARAALTEAVDKMSPQELAELFVSAAQNPMWNTKIISQANLNPSSIILDNVLKPSHIEHNSITYKKEHAFEILKALDSLPEEKQETLSFYKRALGNLLSSEAL